MNQLKTIGILGGGQLGRMLALAGYPLGLSFKIYSPEKDPCASQVSPHVRGEYEDRAALRKFASQVDLITYEFENVPVETVNYLKTFVPIHPSSRALEAAQDRISEKNLFRSLGILTPQFARVDSYGDLTGSIEKIGFPCVLKTRRMGYDGKGQYVMKKKEDVKKAWRKLGKSRVGAVRRISTSGAPSAASTASGEPPPLILEQFIPFDREMSIIAVRSIKGETRFYPLVTNAHREGILRTSTVGSRRVVLLQKNAERAAKKIMNKLRYVGVLAVEFFVKNGRLIANEMAPRVHNSGHWTIEGAETSQFENHLRAIAGLPLGSTQARGLVEMHNIIGKIPDTKKILTKPNTHLHLYGKSEAPGRKLGHVTMVRNSKP